ncbi:MAG TPA: DegT/DnrJ/EryC1/StrS family aminotransferase [Verrucomicrobiae bacterium]|nr:DegT/DnrJ/EryC1/StrS family aminotransferase [Verrucomicrobiae bacterium]
MPSAVKQIPLFKVFMPESVMEPLRTTLMSGYIGQGPRVEEFETALAARLETPHALTLNSATSSLQLALRLSDVGPGDEVITTAMTCTATNWAILAQGAIPVWADIDEKTANIDPQTIEPLITPKTKVIMVVHWGGYPADLDEIWSIARKHHLKVIEDASHAFGSTYKGRHVGTQSDFGVFSFQAIKHMTTVDGGLLVTNKVADHGRGKLLRWYGIDRDACRADFRCENDILEWGWKFHMNDVAATIGLEQLKYVDGIIAKHRDNAAFFARELRNIPGVAQLDLKSDRSSASWIHTIKVSARDQFMAAMQRRGIMTSRVHERNDKHSTVAAYRRPLPQLDRFVREMICIPVGWWVNENERQYIVESIRAGW